MEQVHVSVMLLVVVMFSCVCAGRFCTGRFEAIALGPRKASKGQRRKDCHCTHSFDPIYNTSGFLAMETQKLFWQLSPI